MCERGDVPRRVTWSTESFSSFLCRDPKSFLPLGLLPRTTPVENRKLIPVTLLRDGGWRGVDVRVGSSHLQSHPLARWVEGGSCLIIFVDDK